ncbi:MAG: prenyltransferase/squalene oxidase repeat-containing protein, partial [Candidatus Hodarchaeota archaeon]
LAPNFFFDYIFEKQNTNGAYSDIGGLGNMISTYEAIKTIEVANKSYLNRKIMENETTKIINYLNDSLGRNGWGFRVVPLLNYSDIISTSYAIELAQILSGISILNNENISKYINSTWVITGGYTLTDFSLIPTPETTYHGIKAYTNMNMTYDTTKEIAISTYISSLYNIDSGFRSNLGVISDIESTYYCLASLDLLNLWNLTKLWFNENDTLDFILNCGNPDGGFGQHPVFTTASDFNYGWAAMKALSILEKSYNFTSSIENRINEIRLNYYNWLHDHQAINSLFGHITLEYNYFGVLTLRNYSPENLFGWINKTQAENILAYVYNCYNVDDGGFGSRPDLNSTLFSTYCALNLIYFINPFELDQFQNKSKTVNYLVDLQNPDGGFRVGNDVDYLVSLFGPYYNYFLNLINTNISTVESTYWALIS